MAVLIEDASEDDPDPVTVDLDAVVVVVVDCPDMPVDVPGFAVSVVPVTPPVGSGMNCPPSLSV